MVGMVGSALVRGMVAEGWGWGGQMADGQAWYARWGARDVGRLGRFGQVARG